MIEAPGPIDPLDLSRDFIAERLHFIQSHTACALMFVDMRDDAGAAYCVKALAAHARALVQATNELTAARNAADDAQERREEPATEGRPL